MDTSDNTIHSAVPDKEDISVEGRGRQEAAMEIPDEAREGWFDRIFSQGFTPEDLVLYMLSLLLIVTFWLAFDRLQKREKELLPGISPTVANAWQPSSPAMDRSSTVDDIDMDYPRAVTE